MFYKIRTFLIILLVIIVVFSGLFVVLYNFTPIVDKSLIAVINKISGEAYHIHFKKLSGNLLGTLRLDDVEITSAKNDTIRIRRVEVDYSLMDIMESRYLIERLLILQPYIKWHVIGDSLQDSPAENPPLDSLYTHFSLEQFPHLELGQFILKDGEVFIDYNTETETFKDVQIELSAEITENNVQVKPRYVRASWINRSLEIEDVSFSLMGSRKRIVLNQLEAKIPGANLIGHGEIEFLPRFRFLLFADTSEIEMEVVRRFVQELPYQQGVVRVYGAFIGNPINFNSELYLDAHLDSLKIDHLKTRLRRRGNHFYFDNIQFASNFGQLQGRLHLAPDGSNHIEVQMNRFNLARAGIMNTQTLINAQLNLDFNSWDIQHFTGRGTMIFTDLQYASMNLDTMQLRIAASRGNWEFLQPSEIVFGKDSRFRFQGSLTESQYLDVTLSTEENNLATLFSSMSMENAGGHGSMYLRVFGNLDDPDVEGELTIDSLTVGNTIVYGIDGNLEISRVVSERKGNFKLELATGYIGDIFLTNGIVKSRFTKDFIVFDPFSFYSEENSIRLKGVVFSRQQGWEAIFNRLQFDYQDYSLVNNKPVRFFLRNDSLITQFFSLQASHNEFLTARGFLTTRGNSDFSLNLTNIQLKPLNQYFLWDHSISGVINANMDILGSVENPEVELMVALDKLELDDHPLGKFQSEIIFYNGNLNINYFDYEKDSTSYVTINGGVNLPLKHDGGIEEQLLDVPLDLIVTLSDIRLQDYAFLYNLNPVPEGTLSGRFDLRGTVKKPSGEWNLQGESIIFDEYHFPFFQIEGRLSPERLTIDLGKINFENTVILVNGEKSIVWDPLHPDTLLTDKYFRLRYRIDEDSLNFLGAVNPELDRLVGDIHMEGVVEGNYDQPQLKETKIEVKDGILYLTKLENSIQQMKLMAHQEDSRLILDDVYGRAIKQDLHQNFFQRWISSLVHLVFPRKENGDIYAKGWVDLKDVTRPKINLEVVLNDAYFNYFLENAELVVNSSNLHVEGRDTISITGDVLVKEGDVEFVFEETEKNILLSP
ncbi:MAG: hypothetical protein D6748_02220, partial [Calditrichaeota bacterium]